MILKCLPAFFVGMLFAMNVTAQGTVCSPPADTRQNQYIVGYGSLMNSWSRHVTAITAGEGIPVRVRHFVRGWYVHGTLPGPGAAFLGVVRKQQGWFNAALYALPAKDIARYDARELFYCRVALKSDEVQSLISRPLPAGQIWMYLAPDNKKNLPEKAFPLISSYVDIFLSGCLQLEKKYHLSNFARQCITTTDGWSAQWENDRIFPRRPWQYQPAALEIDSLLKQQLPEIFPQIKLPGSVS